MPISIFSQCDQVFRFSTQGQIDSFQIVHGPCTQVGGITIDESCTATNLYGLSDIVSCDALAILGGLDLVSLIGLENLKIVGAFTYRSDKSFHDGFPSLDTINRITHFFSESDSLNDLSIYKNVKYIAESFVLEGDGHLDGLVNATFSDSINIDIRENDIHNDLVGLIPPSSTELGGFRIYRNNNFSFNGFQNINTVDVFTINQCNNISLEYLSNLESVTTFLRFERARSGWDFSNGLEKITALPCFGISDFSHTADSQNLESLDQLFPNLENINNCLYLVGLDDLNNLDLLTDIEIPQDSGTYTLNQTELPRVIFRDNSQLDNCESPFLCKALETYPDSVIISDNGLSCHIDTIRAYCMTVSTQEIDKANVRLFPNPARDHLILEYGGLVDFVYSIYDVQGRLMHTGNANSQEVDIQDLPHGYYLLEVPVSDGVIRERFVKME